MGTYSDNDPFRVMSDDRVGRVGAVRLQADDQVEEALLRVRFALLAHVVGRRLVEVQTAHCDLGNLILLQLQTTSTNKQLKYNKIKYLINSINQLIVQNLNM